jgi:transcriptional regulator with XRE-family HTH domain
MKPSPYHSNSCGECGAQAIRWKQVDSEVPFRNRKGRRLLASATVPRGTCSVCGAHVYPYEALVLQHEAVCRSLGVLTPREIVNGRKGLGISQEEFAKLASLGVASIRRWERGACIQSKSSDRHLRNALGLPASDVNAADADGFVFRPRSSAMKKLHESPEEAARKLPAPESKFPSFQDQPQAQERS